MNRVGTFGRLLIGVAVGGALAACRAASPTTPSAIQQPIETQAKIQSGPANSQPSPQTMLLAPTPTSVSAELVAQADAAQQVFINIYQRTDPAVVNIEVTLGSGSQPDASGSGFVIDTQGHIVTNNHVVTGANHISVTFYDGYTTDGKVIGTDAYSDLAVVQVNVPIEHLLPASFGDSDTLQVGQRVIAIGNPFGLVSSMTTGIISATGRTLNSNNLQFQNPSIIQIDAAINPGNSGGPLLDIYGKVIGVNAAISTDTGSFQGVGFAIPANTVKRVVPQLIQNGQAQYSWLGIRSIGGRSGLTVAALADQLKLTVSNGVLVTEVLPGSPAEAAGLLGGTQVTNIRGVDVNTGGDIILAINGQTLRDFDALTAYLVDNTAPGDTVTLTVLRNNATIQTKVTLKVRPSGDS